MKILQFIFTMVSTCTISIFLLSYNRTSTVYAWDDCPLGEENDEYPGECGRYIDTDQDGICDHSQPIPEEREEANIQDSDSVASGESNQENEGHEKIYSVEISGQELKELTIQEIANLWEIDSNQLLKTIINKYNFEGPYTVESKLDTLRGEYKFSPAQIKDIAEELKATLPKENHRNNSNKNVDEAKMPYNLSLPLIATIIIYFTTWKLTKSKLAQKYKLFSRIGFNLIWNSILVIGFIPSLVFGILLIFRYRFRVIKDLNFDFLYWHVEGSIVMGTVALLHLITRFKQYFKQWKTLGK